MGGGGRSRLPVSQSGDPLPPHPHGWPQVMNLNQQAVSSQGFTQQTFPEHSLGHWTWASDREVLTEPRF